MTNQHIQTRQRARKQIRTPHQVIADDLDMYGDEEDWEQTRMPVVTRRYDLAPSGIPRRRVDHYHNTPYEVPAVPRRQGFKVHWLLYLGIGLIIALLGYVALTEFGNWWTQHQDDTTYGNPRTFQIDAVVGHGDSNSSPSHFIAVNLRGHISVTEAPGGDMTKAVTYKFPTVMGNAGNPPVTISFQDVNGDGKLDMVVKIGDPGSQVTYLLLNTGSAFTNKT